MSTEDFMARSAARMAEKANPAPLHTITIDGMAYNIRIGFHGRFQFNRVLADGTEQHAGRPKGYASLKECFDAFFVGTMQD